MAASDAKPVPVKNVAYRLYFVALDTAGVRVTGFTSPDSEVSKDGGSVTDCTNEATFVGRGRGYIDLTNTEMNADHVGFSFTCTEGSADVDIYPYELGDIIPAAEIRAAVGLANASLDTVLSSTGVVVASLATGSVTAAALATDAAAEIAAAVLTTAMTESYRATNAAPTLAQAQFELIAHMGESSISSTTKTLKKIDGSTTAKTFSLNSATVPTAITEAT